MQQNAAVAAASSPFSAYGDRPQLGLDVEFGADPASGAAFFQSDGRKHDDLKQMLDSNKDGLKLEAMKRIIGMIARGRDASDLFPAVVKNVVSKNIEVKKLVYVYLVRYAEEQQDLALLSISTFQRALKDPNQLIRASALRVLSSIRVNMIVPIVMLAIRDSAADLSPYVRKTAAHAIPKLYSLDPEQKDELVMVIEKLLSDRTTLVVGSAVMAFDEVCPERVDLIHKNYRKLCNLLVDVDEWGQVIIINMLTRYARTQFEDPNADEDLSAALDALGTSGDVNATNEPFYNDSSATTSSSSSSSSDESDNNNVAKNKNKQQHNSSNNKSKSNKSANTKGTTAAAAINKRRSSSPGTSSYTVDLDHRLLLRQTKPLLQSRNASVVMAVAQLYHHVAPRNEVLLIAKALIRLLRSHKEVQSVVLTCIASMSTKRKAIFEPHIKSFFVRTSDPTHIKLLKLDILTNLASASSISLILREFQTYISSSDRPFVAATIQAIGRCAASIAEVTETCLSGLVHLLSNRDEHVVAESVVVIKKLLQTKAAEHFEIITQMAKLIDFITVSAARAAIIWLIGEYNEKVPNIAPDVLRKMAKTFVDEEDIVKLQILNLGVKLYLTNPQQTSLLCQYVFTLARYDTNYDVRDRARFLRQFIFPANGNSTILSQAARKVFLTPKPAPAPESKYRDSNNFQLGSLSHYLNMRATGYKELPQFPAVAPDSSVRNIEGFMQETSGNTANSSATGVNSKDVTTRKKHQSGGGGGAAAATAGHKQEKSFLSESEGKSSPYTASSTSGSSSDSESSSESSSSSDDDDDANATSSSVSDTKTPVKKAVSKKLKEKVVETKSIAQLEMVNNSVDKSKPLVEINNVQSNNNNSNNIKNKQTDNNGSGTSDSETSSYSSSSDSDTESEAENANANDNNITDNVATGEGIAHNKHLEQKTATTTTTTTVNVTATPKATKSNLDLLLDLDDIPPIGPVMTPSLGGFLTPGTPMLSSITNATLQPMQRIEPVGPSYIEFKHKELFNKLSGHGLQLSYRFMRAPHLYSSAMVSIELHFVNRANDEIKAIQLGQKTLPAGMQLNDFAPIAQLQPQQTATCILGVDFNDSTHAIDLEITSTAGISRLQLKPPIGELIRAVQISENYFKEERTKLRGMNEHQSQISMQCEMNVDGMIMAIKQKVFECINVAYIPTTTTTTTTITPTLTEQHVLYFAGQTLSSKSLVLLTLQWSSEQQQQSAAAVATLLVTVNCEKMVIGSMVLNELRNTLQNHFKMCK